MNSPGTHRAGTATGSVRKLRRVADPAGGRRDATASRNARGSRVSRGLEDLSPARRGPEAPGRGVGAEVRASDGEPFEQQMKRLVPLLREQEAGGRQVWRWQS